MKHQTFDHTKEKQREGTKSDRHHDHIIVPGIASAALRGDRKRWKTSFESSRPRGVRRTYLPSISISPLFRNSETSFSKSPTACSPKSADSSRRSSPRVSLSPRKKLSCNAASFDTSVRCKGACAIYCSSESEHANRAASCSGAAATGIE